MEGIDEEEKYGCYNHLSDHKAHGLFGCYCSFDFSGKTCLLFWISGVRRRNCVRAGKKVAVTIEDGISASDLADLLEKKGLIQDAKVFWVQFQLSKYKNKLQGGSYILNTSQKAEEMLATLAGEEESESET